MEGEGVASTLDAPRALKAELIFAYPMAVVDVVSMRIVEEQQEANLACASFMVLEKGVNRRTAQRVQGGVPVYASLMEVDVVVSMLIVVGVHREVLISANPMEAERDACTPTARRVPWPWEALHSAKAMEEGSVAHLMVAQKVRMEAQISVLRMEVARCA